MTAAGQELIYTILLEYPGGNPPLPKGLGTEIMKAFGVPPSKRLGDLMKQLAADAEDGKVEPGQPPKHYIDYLRTHASEYDLD